MSISTELARITSARNLIRSKMVSLGVCVGTDDISDMSEKIDAIVNNGAVDIEIQEGETYVIPAGWHNGSGSVSGVAGGGNYSLQTKAVTPTKSQQSITPDEGKYGLSAVTVAAIPDNYQDISIVTAEAGDVKTGKVFVDENGLTTVGTMPVNAATTVNATVGGTQTLTAGYYASITVNGPTLTGDAAAANVLSGKKFYSNSGTQQTGSMTNNGAVSLTIDGLTSSSVTVPAGYHDGSGTVSLTNDIETALAAI